MGKNAPAIPLKLETAKTRTTRWRSWTGETKRVETRHKSTSTTPPSTSTSPPSWGASLSPYVSPALHSSYTNCGSPNSSISTIRPSMERVNTNYNSQLNEEFLISVVGFDVINLLLVGAYCHKFLLRV